MKKLNRGNVRETRRPNRAVRLLLLVALALGLSACGVPMDSSAHAIKLGQALVPQASPYSPGGTPTRIALYFVRRGTLVEIKRSGEAFSSIETTANELLLDLDNGPTTSEGSNLVTLLNSNPGLSCTFNPQTHIITVSLDIQFVETLYGPPLYEAYGQIVLTLMQSPLLSTVQGINFRSVGAPSYAYLPNETATANPVTAASYKSLLAPKTK